MTVQVQVSDLFQAHGHTFDWEKRISDQNKLKERIHEANKDILNPKALDITHVADLLGEFIEDGIISLNAIDIICRKLQSHGVVLV